MEEHELLEGATRFQNQEADRSRLDGVHGQADALGVLGDER